MVAVPVSVAQLPHVSEALISGVNDDSVDKITVVLDARCEETVRLCLPVQYSVRSRTPDVVTENASERA